MVLEGGVAGVDSFAVIDFAAVGEPGADLDGNPKRDKPGPGGALVFVHRGEDASEAGVGEGMGEVEVADGVNVAAGGVEGAFLEMQRAEEIVETVAKKTDAGFQV